MARVASVLLVAWALFLLPAFCVAGIVSHACDCESEAAPAACAECRNDPSEHPHESNCNHESGCGADPCTDTVARADRHNDEPLTVEIFAASALDDGNVQMLAPIGESVGTALPESRCPDSVHRSDIPLLI